MKNLSPAGRRCRNSIWMRFAIAFSCTVALNGAVHAEADCYEQAGAYQGVNPLILRAIVWFESKGNPDAVHRNADGSVDIGQAQINSIHFNELRRNGVPPGALRNACVNVYVAAWMLKQKMLRHGNTWRAIGAYHSETPRLRDQYARDIHAVLVSWGASE